MQKSPRHLLSLLGWIPDLYVVLVYKHKNQAKSQISSGIIISRFFLETSKHFGWANLIRTGLVTCTSLMSYHHPNPNPTPTSSWIMISRSFLETSKHHGWANFISIGRVQVCFHRRHTRSNYGHQTMPVERDDHLTDDRPGIWGRIVALNAVPVLSVLQVVSSSNVDLPCNQTRMILTGIKLSLSTQLDH